MNESEKRKHDRIHALNLLNYVCRDDQGEPTLHGMGRTLNLSESGILLETHVMLEPRQHIFLTIGFEEDLIDIQGRIVYSKPAESGRFQSGIQFMEKDEQTQSLLKLYIDVFQKELQESDK